MATDTTTTSIRPSSVDGLSKLMLNICPAFHASISAPSRALGYTSLRYGFPVGLGEAPGD